VHGCVPTNKNQNGPEGPGVHTHADEEESVPGKKNQEIECGEDYRDGEWSTRDGGDRCSKGGHGQLNRAEG